MTRRLTTIGLRGATSAARAAMRFAACACVLAASASAQDAQRPPPAPAPAASQEAAPSASANPGPPDATAPAAPAPGPNYKPGFIDAFGRWIDEGASKFKSGMQDAQERWDKFHNRAREAAKEATGTVMSLPNTRVVTGRERCIMAANGAPDCQAAATTVCRGKGFQSGKGLDTQSEQKCPARVLLEGRAPNGSECPTEIFVTRAVCQ